MTVKYILLSEKSRPKRLHIASFHLYDILEKKSHKKTDQWLLGVMGGESDRLQRGNKEEF